MHTLARAIPSDEVRACGISAKLGYRLACPGDGCALLRALGEELPADPQATCPVEELAAGDNDLVLRTLDELRREMQSHLAKLRSLRAERTRGIRHADAPPSPVAIVTPPCASTGAIRRPSPPTSLHPILADYLTDAVTRHPAYADAVGDIAGGDEQRVRFLTTAASLAMSGMPLDRACALAACGS